MKVLVVDDFLGTAKVIKFMFEKSGLNTDIALNAKDAIELINHNKYDYVLLDIIINGDRENGFYIYSYLKGNNFLGNVIFITGCDEKSDFALQAQEFAPVVFKEFSIKKLAEDIKKGIYAKEKISL